MESTYIHTLRIGTSRHLASFSPSLGEFRLCVRGSMYVYICVYLLFPGEEKNLFGNRLSKASSSSPGFLFGSPCKKVSRSIRTGNSCKLFFFPLYNCIDLRQLSPLLFHAVFLYVMLLLPMLYDKTGCANAKQFVFVKMRGKG